MRRILFQIVLFLLTLLLYNGMCNPVDPNWCKKDHHCEMPANWIVYACDDCDSITTDGLTGFFGSFYNQKNGDIQHDSKGNIWFYNYKGLIKFDGISFTKLQIPINYSDSSTVIFYGLGYYNFFIDSKDNVWLTAPNCSISKFDGNNWIMYSTAGVLSGFYDRICSIFEDRTGVMWFGTWKGYIISFDGIKFESRIQPSSLFYPLIIRILGDSNGNIYFLRNSDILKYDGTNFSITKPLRDTNSDYGYNLTSFFIDKTDNIWICSSGSSYAKYDNTNWTWFTIPKIDYDPIVDINQDNLGKIWLVYLSDSVVSFDVNNLNHQTFKLGSRNFISGSGKIVINKNNDKWILNPNSVVYRYTGQ